MPKDWPGLSNATTAMLVGWGLRQSQVRPWVMLRTAQYWEAGQAKMRQLDAWACLEVLQWQTGLETRAALQWLKDIEES